MNKYFKFQSDSDLGAGIQYIEFSQKGWAIRQAERYGDRWFNSNESYHKETGSMGLCDQQLTEAGMKLGELIDAEEFYLAWKLSNRELISSHYFSKKELREEKVKLISEILSMITMRSPLLKVIIRFGILRVFSSLYPISSSRLDRSPDKQGIDSAEGETDSTF